MVEVLIELKAHPAKQNINPHTIASITRETSQPAQYLSKTFFLLIPRDAKLLLLTLTIKPTQTGIGSEVASKNPYDLLTASEYNLKNNHYSNIKQIAKCKCLKTCSSDFFNSSIVLLSSNFPM